jgi:hypothetical protein
MGCLYRLLLLVLVLHTTSYGNQKSKTLINFFKSKISSLEERSISKISKEELPAMTVFEQIRGKQIGANSLFTPTADITEWVCPGGGPAIRSVLHRSWNPFDILVPIFTGFDIEIVSSPGPITKLWIPSSIQSVVCSPDFLYLAIVTEDGDLLASYALIMLFVYNIEKMRWNYMHTIKQPIGHPLTFGMISMAARAFLPPFASLVSFSTDGQFIKIKDVIYSRNGDALYSLYEPAEWHVFNEISDLSSQELDILYRLYENYTHPSSVHIGAEEKDAFYEQHPAIANLVQKYMQRSYASELIYATLRMFGMR